MKKERLLGIMNFIVIFLVFFTGFQIIKLKGGIISYAILSMISGCILYFISQSIS